MLKVMRKYNKVILVVGGSLLMVAFLMPQAIQQLGSARLGKSVGTMDGHKITLAQYDTALRELRGLELFLGAGGAGFPIGLEDGKRTEHWLLLTTEAERAGLVGGADEGEQLLPVLAREIVRSDYQRQYRQYADMLISSQPEQFEQAVNQRHQALALARTGAAREARLQLEEFDKGLARLRGVVRMMNFYHGAERLSDRQTVAIADKLADSVLIDAVFLQGRQLADETLTPTPEQLQAHFDRFKDVQPNTGEFGIGFLLPPRAKVEWIALDRPAISEAVKISLVDVRTYWTQNRDQFPGEFEEERERVEATLRAAEVDRIMNTAESVVRSAILTAVRPLPEEGNYRVLPPDWAQKRPSFMALAEEVVAAVQNRHGTTIPLPPVYIRGDEWMDGGMLQSLPGIGRATVAYEGQRVSFPQVVMAARELAGENILGVQENLPLANLPAEGPDRSRYYFAVLDTAPQGVPESIDDLLDPEAVTQTWRAMQFFEQTTASAESIAATVTSEGLEAYAKSFGQGEAPEAAEGVEPPPAPDRVTVQENARVTEAGTTIQGLEDSAEVISAVREKGRTIDPKVAIDEVPISDRVVVVPVPSRLGVLVAQINGVEPLTRETRPIVADYARRSRTQELFQGIGVPYPYRYPILEKRHAFSLKQSDEDTTADAGTDTGTEAGPDAEEPTADPAAQPEPDAEG